MKRMESTIKYNRNSPSPRYLELIELYQQMHTQGCKEQNMKPIHTFTGASLLAHIKDIKTLCEIFDVKSILDYGCGKGIQYAPIELMDAHKNIVFKSIKDYWQVKSVSLYDAGYEPFAMLPNMRSDGVICTNVLEHIDELDIDWVIDELFSYAKKFVFSNIACFEGAKILPNGDNAHCTVKEPSWWGDKLETISQYYPKIKYKVGCVYEHNDSFEEMVFTNIKRPYNVA